MKKVLAAALVFAFSTAHAAQDPEAVFNRACTMCHSDQLPMAPKKGNRVAWKPCLEQGTDVLVKHVIEGFNTMPARSLCMDCSPEDYKAVIDSFTYGSLHSHTAPHTALFGRARDAKLPAMNFFRTDCLPVAWILYEVVLFNGLAYSIGHDQMMATFSGNALASGSHYGLGMSDIHAGHH